MGRVVVLGSLSQDLHLHMARHPVTGETVMSSDIEHRFGGKGANQAVAAVRAGASTVFVARVGDDPSGREYLRRLAAFGVDTSRMRVDPEAPTGTAVIYNDADGDNMIVVAPGANHRIDADDLTFLDHLTADDILLMPLELEHHVVIAAVEAATGRGARVIVNLAPFAPLPAAVLAACDPVIVNEHEAALLAEAGLPVESLLVTLGPEGSRWGDEQVAATSVEAVDTTGAGDAYCGTLAARLARGDDRHAAMIAASTAAAACVQHHGAQPPLPQEN